LQNFYKIGKRVLPEFRLGKRRLLAGKIRRGGGAVESGNDSGACGTLSRIPAVYLSVSTLTSPPSV